ncbi:hypothetical protein [Natronorubrum tibetense]|uniref:hypothetical protein n=1 Tax=Natronorubrum tibetense TaxID=63128 RepID=UPI001268DB13|nr:hypothetical protein [Natronorubrum tibetense]
MLSVNLVGLVLGLIGTAFVILPTFEVVRNLIIDSREVKMLDKARRELLRAGEIHREDCNFQPITSVIEQKWENEIPEDSNSIYSVAFGVWGGGGFVCLTDSEGNPQRDDSKRIGSVLIVETWIRDEIDRLQSTPVQRIRGIGFGLVVISVFIQTFSSI